MHFLGPPPNGKNAKSDMICSHHNTTHKVSIVTRHKRAICRRFFSVTYLFFEKDDPTLRERFASFGFSPRSDIVPQGFEMGQSQPILQFHCSSLFLKTSRAQNRGDYPKSMEICEDYTPESRYIIELSKKSKVPMRKHKKIQKLPLTEMKISVPFGTL